MNKAVIFPGLAGRDKLQEILWTKKALMKKARLIRGTASLLTCAWRWPCHLSGRAASCFTYSTALKVLNVMLVTRQMLDPANCSLSHPHFFSFFSFPSSPPLLFSLPAVTAPSQMKFCFVKSTNRIQKRKKLAKSIVSAFSFLRSTEWRIYLEKKVPKINLMDNKSS